MATYSGRYDDSARGCCYGANHIVARGSGEGTGDELVQTADGQWWLVVREFRSDRATGERRGVMSGGCVHDV